MIVPRAPSSLLAVLPLLYLAACGDRGGEAAGSATGATAAAGGGEVGVEAAGGGGTDGTGVASGAEGEPAAALAGTGLEGLSIRRVGLVDVRSAKRGEWDGVGSETLRDVTDVEVAFTALDAPLDADTLARVAISPQGMAGCRAGPEARSIDALLESGTPSFAGEVLTVSTPAGSWFELHGIDDELDGPFYRLETGGFDLAYDPSAFSFPGVVEGHVGTGTTIDIPGDEFPAFAGMGIPPVSASFDAERSATEVRWHAGPDPEVPVLIDVRFEDYVALELDPVDPGGALTDSDYANFTDDSIVTLVEAPADVRCLVPDSGRFVFPESLRATMAEFRAAGEAVADRLASGSDLDPEGAARFSAIDVYDGDELTIDQGTSVGVSRIATRYRAEGDALLIVHNSSGELAREAP